MCWVEHMQLDQTTGLDPEGVMLRAAEGLGAVDYLLPTYHVWGELIEAFGDLGYNSNQLVRSPAYSPPSFAPEPCYNCVWKLL